MNKKIRALALYLPQYHPIPENDKWWGKGFTEWRNVVKGKAVVKDQYQPHIPSDLGFYDLRVPEVREEQARLAKENDIYGFCYYHYWFNGKQLLERPVNEVIESGRPDFPFCLCWANENWTKKWNGLDQDVLIKQNHSKEDDKAHIKYLCENVFCDERYIKIDGKPVFIVYRPALLPDAKATAQLWREECKKHGFPDMYLIFFWSFGLNQNPKDYGFDAAALFPPNSIKVKSKTSTLIRLANKISNKIFKRRLLFIKNIKYGVYEYDEIVKGSLSLLNSTNYTLFPGITPMWDNIARMPKGKGRTFVNSTPKKYQSWLENICSNWEVPNEKENFLFINAWNEWAEGNHLEPCEKWGHQYLEATKKVLNKFK